jgi:hypothetical protein
MTVAVGGRENVRVRAFTGENLNIRVFTGARSVPGLGRVKTLRWAGRNRRARQSPHGLFKAVVQMILDQGLLGLADRLLDRVELLGDVQAGAPALSHLDDAVQVPFRASEALYDLAGMALVAMIFMSFTYPPGGILQGCRLQACIRDQPAIFA